MLALAAVCSVAILLAWFPTSSLLHQRSQLAGAAVQLEQLNRANAALRQKEAQLRTPGTIGRIAQQQYDLVAPGEEAYQVLPPSGSARAGGPAGTLAMTAPEGLGSSHAEPNHASTAAGSGAAGVTSESFFGRIVKTLEFWR